MYCHYLCTHYLAILKTQDIHQANEHTAEKWILFQVKGRSNGGEQEWMSLEPCHYNNINLYPFKPGVENMIVYLALNVSLLWSQGSHADFLWPPAGSVTHLGSHWSIKGHLTSLPLPFSSITCHQAILLAREGWGDQCRRQIKLFSSV
jgi:hypothetical protein